MGHMVKMVLTQGLGAINWEPERDKSGPYALRRVGSDLRAAARRGPIYRAQGTSRSDVPVR